MKNIAAVIVTYNRIALLKEAVAAIKGQSFPVAQIIVVNNGSTDGTDNWLKEQVGIHIITQVNSGGSGGFYTGIKAAAQQKADWIWVMDDDTICKENTLEKLVAGLESTSEEIGFICSKCIWTDGNPHMMNIPDIKPAFNGKIAFNTYDAQQLLLVESCSFVSLLINTAVVKKVGLPYKEFFIWGDDQEYTRRISSSGYLGIYCAESTALHKTPINYFPDFYNDTVSNLWKHKYGFRNEFFIIKRDNGLIYFTFWLLAKVIYTSARLLKGKDKDKLKFLGVLLNAAWNSIFFNPKIDRLK